jgi:hypothetical protein
MQALRELVERRDEPVTMLGLQCVALVRANARADFRSAGVPQPGPAVDADLAAAHPVRGTIDHVLCTAPLLITRRDVGPDVGSGHRPGLVELRWMPKAGPENTCLCRFRDSLSRCAARTVTRSVGICHQ